MQQRRTKAFISISFIYSFVCAATLLALSGCCLFSSDISMGEPDRQPETQQQEPQMPEKNDTPLFTGLSGKYPAEAEMAFAKARVLWKRDAASAALGEVCSDPESAVLHLDKAIRIAPEYADAYVRRGLAKSDLGLAEQAFDDITAGIRLSPTAEAYAYRGLVSLRGKNARAAKKDLDYSLELNASQHLARNYLGVLALAEDNHKEACKAFNDGCDKGDCSFLESAKKEKICP